MSSPLHPQPASGTTTTVRDVTCTACGCLCDDLVVTVAGGRIEAAERACDLGRAWFLADHSHTGLPAATIEGVSATIDQALDRAADLLTGANAPIVIGLTQTTTEAVAAAIGVADRIGAVVDWDLRGESADRILAVQRVGRVSATLGEVKNRADVVVFWGVDPIVTHPRHWERYSVEPRGRFVPSGRDGRTVIVVDAEPTATSARADRFVQVAPDAWFATLWTLRALLRGNSLEADRVRRATGLLLEDLTDLSAQLEAAHYGAFFFGTSLSKENGNAGVEAALCLVRDLNADRRFVILGLGAAGNAAGAEAALTWQTGYPSCVSLAGPSPSSLVGANSAVALLETSDADAALIVADPIAEHLSDAAQRRLNAIPTILIAPKATEADRRATVALDVATFGIDAPGTVTRVDGVALPLRPPLKTTVPTDLELLRRLADRLDARELRI